VPRPKQAEGRKHRRIEVHYVEVSYAAAGQTLKIGFSGNLSGHGMMIRTPRVLPPGTLLKIELRFPQRSLTVSGRVVWAREGPAQWLASGRVGMGVKFVDPPPDLADLVKGAASGPEAGRGDRKS